MTKNDCLLIDNDCRAGRYRSLSITTGHDQSNFEDVTVRDSIHFWYLLMSVTISMKEQRFFLVKA